MIDFSPVRADARKTYELPPGWQWARLSQVARLESGHTPSRRRDDFWGGDVQWLSLKDIRDFSGRYIHQTADHPTPLGIQNSSARVLPQGTVALCRTASVGKTVILGQDMATSQDFVSWICGPRLLPEYLHAALVAAAPEFDRLKQGSTHKTIYMPTVEDFVVALPPPTEQQRIAEVLDRAESLRAKRRAALAALETLTHSIFIEMFGDPQKEDTRWPIVSIETVVRETKLGLVRGSQEFGPEFPIPYVRMDAIQRNGELALADVQRTHATEAEVEVYNLEQGDLLFNTRNSEELVGKTALYRGVGLHLFNNNLMRMRFTAEADPVYVAAAFKTPFVQHALNLRKSGTTNVFAIYYKDLRSLPLPLPPIRLQHEFAHRAVAVEKLKMVFRSSLAELDALFSSLQYRAFRGEL